MPNLGLVLKEEIQRLARKEVRAAVTPVHVTNAIYMMMACTLGVQHSCWPLFSPPLGP